MKQIAKLYIKLLMPLALAIVVSNSATAQKTYLTIFESDKKEDQISYPPGTSYKLMNSEDEVILTEESEAGTYKITEPSTLIVSPTYKEEKDRFELTEGSIQINLTKYFFKNEKSGYSYHSNGVTADKTLTYSEKNPDMQNVKLELSNGIIFKYTDGVANATLNNEELRIDGKYLVYSKLGVAKISFNPKNGVLYWVFEPKK